MNDFPTTVFKFPVLLSNLSHYSSLSVLFFPIKKSGFLPINESCYLLTSSKPYPPLERRYTTDTVSVSSSV